jgi:hypothetical protein
MNQLRNISQNEDGYVLVVALLIMAILSLIGIAGINTSMFEVQVAGNDWNAKKTFYMADGGISRGSELVEQSIACATGFASNSIEDFHVSKLNIYNNDPINPATVVSSLDDPKGSIDPKNKYDAAYPGSGGALPDYDVGYLYFGGETNVLPGGALQMAAGYEGKGKSSAQGGAAKIYDIYSQFLGPRNSESIIVIGWRHLIGNEGDCIY